MNFAMMERIRKVIIGVLMLFPLHLWAFSETSFSSLSQAKKASYTSQIKKKTAAPSAVLPKEKRISAQKKNIVSSKDTSVENERYFIDESRGNPLKKGTINVNALFSGKIGRTTDVDLIFAGIDNLKQKSYRINLGGSYFIKDRVSVGLSGIYTVTNYDLQANLLQNFLSRDIKLSEKSISVNPFIENYIPLSDKDLIYITNRTELQFTYEDAAYHTLVNKNDGPAIPTPGVVTPQVMQQKFTQTLILGVGIRPGILVFLTPKFALETNIGIFSLSYKTSKLRYNYPNEQPQTPKENRTNNSYGLDFKLDILKFGFGFSYYF